jgi:hypothetical protein
LFKIKWVWTACKNFVIKGGADMACEYERRIIEESIVFSMDLMKFTKMEIFSALSYGGKPDSGL